MNPLTLEIKRLTIDHSKELSELLQSADKDYTQYFIPFVFDFEIILKILSNAIKDQYYGIFTDNKLVGFYMLRGFDEGYEIPSYGVWVAKDFSSKGISKLTLQHAISFCKINNIKKIILKVHPDNVIAKNIYESFGFIFEGVDKRIGHLIYYKII
ncbi:MAG: GNAT family N-acetyltransferase [Ignavibacteriaceae bacterium]